MQRKNDTIKINLTAGVLPAGDFLTIVTAAEQARAESIQFGSRQQLFVRVPVEYSHTMHEALGKAGIFYELNEDEYPNIVSSFVAENVFHNAGWMSEGIYRDVLDTFNFRSRLKINIVDSGQSFTPFFTGNLNFISSPLGNYWFLYVRFPKTSIIYRWPGLLYSADLNRISQLIEEIIFTRKKDFYDQEMINTAAIHQAVEKREKFIMQPIKEELSLPDFTLPYYEGFNRYANKIWLGIYRRAEQFPVSFMKDICLVCLQTKLSQVYITPWKSLIIKDIEAGHRKLWDYMLGKYRINVRHASNELNWQVEDLCEDGLILKRYLVSQFDREDLRTFGLCFAIKTRPKSGLFGSVIIRSCGSTNQPKRLERYDILYTKDFNPNSKELVLFRGRVSKENLCTYLVSLCKYYYELQSGTELINHKVYREQIQEDQISETPAREIYECADCFTVYDEQFGDILNDIAPGISFHSLPDSYCCPTCGAHKNNFDMVRKPLLLQ
jgi:rubredoxin